MKKYLFKTLFIVILLFVVLLFASACACEHEWKPATCTTPQICSKCGEVQGTALGHNYSNATCDDPEKCLRCWQTRGVALGHTVTCADEKPCSRCGKILRHYYKGVIKTGEIYCTGCYQSLSMDNIGTKQINELTLEEKAYIQWVINNNITALDKYGKYLYTISEAYSISAVTLGLSSAIVKVFWEGHYGMTPYNTIYSPKR